jgi:hypothetical protein
VSKIVIGYSFSVVKGVCKRFHKVSETVYYFRSSSTHLSVRMYQRGPPLAGFSWNLILETKVKISRENYNFINIGHLT